MLLTCCNARSASRLYRIGWLLVVVVDVDAPRASLDDVSDVSAVSVSIVVVAVDAPRASLDDVCDVSAVSVSIVVVAVDVDAPRASLDDVSDVSAVSVSDVVVAVAVGDALGRPGSWALLTLVFGALGLHWA